MRTRSSASDWAEDDEILKQAGVLLIKPELEPQPLEEIKYFDVWPDNGDVVCLYMACQTQWDKQLIIPPLGGEIITDWRGFNYQGIEVVIRNTPQFRNSKDTDLFQKLQLMEAEALQYFAEKG